MDEKRQEKTFDLGLDLSPNQVRENDPNTSKEAVRLVNQNLSQKRKMILKTIAMSKNGLASFQIAERLGIPRDSISPQMRPLEQLGCVIKSGRVKKNPLTNAHSEIWILTDKFKASRQGQSINRMSERKVAQSKLDRLMNRRKVLDNQIHNMVKNAVEGESKLYHLEGYKLSRYICRKSPIGYCVYGGNNKCYFCNMETS